MKFISNNYVTGIVTKKFNRTTQTLVPGSATFKAILWYGNRLSNKLNRHHTTADILSQSVCAGTSCRSRSITRLYQHVHCGFCLSIFLQVSHPWLILRSCLSEAQAELPNKWMHLSAEPSLLHACMTHAPLCIAWLTVYAYSILWILNYIPCTWTCL